jgi:DNA-binding transcriptional LysR family regulator
MIDRTKHSGPPSNGPPTSSKRDPNINFVSIEQALVVADYGSFRRAAHAPGVQQSAVSRRVQSLENNLGVSLFERQTSGLRLTRAGRHFFDRTRPAFDAIQSAVKHAASAGRGADGAIRVGLSTPISPFLGDLLKLFRAEHPGVQFDFNGGPTRDHIAGIMDRSLDAAFVVQAPETPDFDIIPLWSARIFVAMPEAHVLGVGKEIDWAYLQDERFIFGRDEGDGALINLVHERFGEIDQHPEINRHAVAPDVVMLLVALGFGLTLVSEPIANISYPGVSFRPLVEEKDCLTVSVIWLPENDNPALRRFLSLMRFKAAHQQSATPATKQS